MSEARQTVAGAYAEIEKHEAVCVERYTRIDTAIGEIKAELRWITRGIVAVLVTISGWALVQVVSGHPSEARPLPKPAPVAACNAAGG